jgi:fumarylacetoacetate (FAA) hydrolase
MKLASLRDGRDGRLVLVSHDLRRAAAVPHIAQTLQDALDRWSETAPQLEDRARQLEEYRFTSGFELDPARLAAPLPRAYQWADGSAYLHHVELVRRARGADMPASFRSDPLLYQGGSDSFLGPCEDIVAVSEDHGIDFEAEIAVVTDDVPMGCTARDAAAHIVLVMLVNDVSLRNLIPDELAKGFGFFQGKPSSAFSPAAVTPHELGPAWDGGRLHLPLFVHLNGQKFGSPNAGPEMTFDFPQLIAHAARTRSLGAGTVIGSGTVSNRDPSVGSCCIAERRVLEKLGGGEIKTAFMRFGDRVRIEMFDAEGASIFGAIDQRVVPFESPGR